MTVSNLPDELEKLVDATNFFDVLAALSTVATDKSSHLRANWGDATGGRLYDRLAGKIESVARWAGDNL